MYSLIHCNLLFTAQTTVEWITNITMNNTNTRKNIKIRNIKYIYSLNNIIKNIKLILFLSSTNN